MFDAFSPASLLDPCAFTAMFIDEIPCVANEMHATKHVELQTQLHSHWLEFMFPVCVRSAR